MIEFETKVESTFSDDLTLPNFYRLQVLAHQNLLGHPVKYKTE